MYYDLLNGKVLENCKIKKLTNKIISATWKINKIQQTKTYEFKKKVGKIKLVIEIDLKRKYEVIKHGNN